MISETEALLGQLSESANLLHEANGRIAKLDGQLAEASRMLEEERELTVALEGVCAAYRCGRRTPAKHLDTIARIRKRRADDAARKE